MLFLLAASEEKGVCWFRAYNSVLTAMTYMSHCCASAAKHVGLSLIGQRLLLQPVTIAVTASIHNLKALTHSLWCCLRSMTVQQHLALPGLHALLNPETSI